MKKIYIFIILCIAFSNNLYASDTSGWSDTASFEVTFLTDTGIWSDTAEFAIVSDSSYGGVAYGSGVYYGTPEVVADTIRRINTNQYIQTYNMIKRRRLR